MIGSWKNINDLEESITLDEMFLLLNKGREMKGEEHQFAASLKGIDLRGAEQERKLQEVKERAAKKANPNWEQDTLEALGITFEQE